MSDMLKKLEERQAKLKKQIKNAKAEAAKKEKAAHSQKCRIIGAAVLAAMEKSPQLVELVNSAVNDNVTAPKDRKLLGLEPLKS